MKRKPGQVRTSVGGETVLEEGTGKERWALGTSIKVWELHQLVWMEGKTQCG